MQLGVVTRSTVSSIGMLLLWAVAVLVHAIAIIVATTGYFGRMSDSFFALALARHDFL